MPYSFHNANKEKQNRKLGKHALFMYIGKTKPWPAKLSRSKKKNEQKRELMMKKQQPPLPRFLMNQRKKEKKKKENRFLKHQEQQKASVHCSLKLKTNVQREERTGF